MSEALTATRKRRLSMDLSYPCFPNPRPAQRYPKFAERETSKLRTQTFARSHRVCRCLWPCQSKIGQTRARRERGHEPTAESESNGLHPGSAPPDIFDSGRRRSRPRTPHPLDNPFVTRCDPCLRNVLSPMSPVWTRYGRLVRGGNAATKIELSARRAREQRDPRQAAPSRSASRRASGIDATWET